MKNCALQINNNNNDYYLLFALVTLCKVCIIVTCIVVYLTRMKSGANSNTEIIN